MITTLSRKSFKLSLACMIVFALIWPFQSAEAAVITDIRVSANTPYLIAGVKYAAYVKTDKAGSTNMATSISYSPNNSNVWVFLNNTHHDGKVPITVIHLAVDIFDSDYNKYDAIIPFSIPLDPDITSARVKVNSFFDPLIGSKSSSERVLGPYEVKQPGDPENLEAVSNEDGTVTLSWDDRTNMEKYYEISRSGPDGVKTFTYEGTTDYIGNLTFHDKSTDKSKDTFYMYRVTPVVHEKYALPEHLRMASISKLVKTKAPIKLPPPGQIIISPVIKVDFKSSDYVITRIPDLTQPINPSTEIKRDLDIYNRYIDKIGTIPNLESEPVKQFSVESVGLNANELKLKTGSSVTLNATVKPAAALNKTVTWKSDNPAVVTVDASGVIRAVSNGTATIKVTTEEGGFTATCVVTVEADESKGQPPAIQFTDTENHWANDEIAKAVMLGVVNGYTDGTFKPEASITRAEFTVMLMRGLNAKEPVTPLSFKDTKEIKGWAAEYVQQAVAKGIINGYTDGTFRPNANITHAEMIAMVVRASGLLGPNPANQPTTYADDQSIPSWAKPSIAIAQQKGIVFGGIKNNKFHPNVNATRAESASSIVKLLSL